MNIFYKILTKQLIIILLLCGLKRGYSQNNNDFWNHVRFGGSVGLSIGNGYTDVTLAPGALYQFNKYVAAGAGIQGTYVNYKDFYQSFIYGGSVIGIFSPIPEVQLSAELEQLRVNLNFSDYYSTSINTINSYSDNNFWNTALFLGVGYNTGPVTVGLRFNVLYKESNLVYSTAYMPFVRVYF